jgi:RNA polymerase sigma-70 factor, ECF subfamily
MSGSPPRLESTSGPPDPAEPARELTRFLQQWATGDRSALDHLVPATYGELQRIAHRELARERPGHTLDTTALVHEAYLKLAGQASVRAESRAHFFAVAARAMRTILIDHARARATAKRGGGGVPVTLDRLAEVLPANQEEDLLALDDALDRLAEINEEAVRVVECRYFAGLTLEEIADALETSVATVRRRWAFARAWLQRELRDGADA